MKILFLNLAIIFLIYSPSFANRVSDNNNGNAGDVLVNTGLNNGNNTIGTWVSPEEFKGPQGDQGIQGEAGAQGKGLKDRYEVMLEARLLDTRKTTTSLYFIHDINNHIQTGGIKFTYKIGKSYEEKLLEKIVNDNQ